MMDAAKVNATLAEFLGYDVGWDGNSDGAVPPSLWAIDAARTIALAAIRLGFPPERLVPDVNGGVAVYWASADTLPDGSHRRLAALKVTNGRGWVATRKDRAADTFDAEDCGATVAERARTRTDTIKCLAAWVNER